MAKSSKKMLMESDFELFIEHFEFISKHSALGRPTLSSHYFKSNFRSIKSVCRETDLFQM